MKKKDSEKIKNELPIDLEKNRKIANASGATVILIEKEIDRIAKAIEDTTKKLSFLF